MSGGFWAGAIPPWAYVAFACVCVLFLCVGELDGWRRGEREAREDESWEREQPKARRTHPVYRERRPVPLPGAPSIFGPPPEVAHEAWLAHEEQALAVANWCPDGVPGCNIKHAQPDPEPDTRSDEEWMAEEFAKLGAFMDSVLNAHPVTEDL